MELDTSLEAAAPGHRIREYFAAIIKVQLARKGWTQSELARRAGVGRDLVSGYANGKTLPTPANAAKLAEAFGIATEDLMPLEPVDGSTDLTMVPLSPGVFRVRFDRVLHIGRAVELVKLVESWEKIDGPQRPAELDMIKINIAGPAKLVARVDCDYALTHERALELAGLMAAWTAE